MIILITLKIQVIDGESKDMIWHIKLPVVDANKNLIFSELEIWLRVAIVSQSYFNTSFYHKELIRYIHKPYWEK